MGGAYEDRSRGLASAHSAWQDAGYGIDWGGAEGGGMRRETPSSPGPSFHVVSLQPRWLGLSRHGVSHGLSSLTRPESYLREASTIPNAFLWTKCQQ